jgi:hypothetical protein
MKKEFVVKSVKEDGSLEEKKYFVSSPSNQAIKAAEIYKTKTWQKCISDGVLTKPELNNLLKSRGLWSDDKEREEVEIGREINKLEKVLFLGDGSGKRMKLSDGKQIVMEMKKLRFKLRDLIAEKIAMEENTADSISDNARFDYLVSECVFNEDGTRVYKNIEDYNQRSGDQVAFLGASTLAQMIYNYDTNYQEALPENLWLKKFNLVNKDLDFVDKEGHLVDSEGRRINELGHFLDEEGRRVDKDGNLLNEDGSYVLQVEYVDEEEPETPPPKKKVKVKE